MQPQENRPVQTLETSAKFGSWNIKGIDEKLGSYLPQIAGYMQAQSRAADRQASALERIANALEKLAKMPATGKTSADDDIPF